MTASNKRMWIELSPSLADALARAHYSLDNAQTVRAVKGEEVWGVPVVIIDACALMEMVKAIEGEDE